MTEDKQSDPIKVDLEKGSSRDFEIRTMADDLQQPSAGASNESFGSELESKARPNFSEQASSAVKEALPRVDLREAPKMPSEPSQAEQVPPIKDTQTFSTPPPSSPPPSQEPPEFLLEEDEPKGGWMKSFFIGFGVVLFLGILGVAGWWFFTNRTPKEPPPPPPLEDTPSPVITDSSLVPVDKTLTIDVGQEETRQSLFDQVNALISVSTEELNEGNMIRIALNRDTSPLPLSEFATFLGLDFSPYTASERFTLLFFIQNGQEVFGLVVPTSPTLTKDMLLEQEADLPLMINALYADYTKSALPQGSSEIFLDNIYQGVGIRYLNFDTPNKSFDYALYNNLLLLGGSREMMFTLIDRALLQDELR